METANANSAPAFASQTAEKLIRHQTLLTLLDSLHSSGEIDGQTKQNADAVTAIHSGINPASIFL